MREGGREAHRADSPSVAATRAMLLHTEMRGSHGSYKFWRARDRGLAVFSFGRHAQLAYQAASPGVGSRGQRDGTCMGAHGAARACTH
eukprot:3179885-Pleurochrysis_carterae.AAC.1